MLFSISPVEKSNKRSSPPSASTRTRHSLRLVAKETQSKAYEPLEKSNISTNSLKNQAFLSSLIKEREEKLRLDQLEAELVTSDVWPFKKTFFYQYSIFIN